MPRFLHTRDFTFDETSDRNSNKLTLRESCLLDQYDIFWGKKYALFRENCFYLHPRARISLCKQICIYIKVWLFFIRRKTLMQDSKRMEKLPITILKNVSLHHALLYSIYSFRLCRIKLSLRFTHRVSRANVIYLGQTRVACACRASMIVYYWNFDIKKLTVKWQMFFEKAWRRQMEVRCNK